MDNIRDFIEKINTIGTAAAPSFTRAELMAVAAICPARRINDDADGGKPYLERYFLCESSGVNFHLHRFIRARTDEEIHDHPFAARTAVLIGGYTEDRMEYLDLPTIKTTSLRLDAGSSQKIEPNTFHRIHSIDPETWTLFAHGPRSKRWGFLKTTDLGVLYHNPFDNSDPKWYESAPMGAEIMRPITPGVEL